jgi:hypothetical protein
MGRALRITCAAGVIELVSLPKVFIVDAIGCLPMTCLDEEHLIVSLRILLAAVVDAVWHGGRSRARTADLLLVRQAL